MTTPSTTTTAATTTAATTSPTRVLRRTDTAADPGRVPSVHGSSRARRPGVSPGGPGYRPRMADDGDVGGFAGRIGARLDESEDGTATLVFEVRDEHLNPAGTLHGGVVATLVDTAMGQAVRTTTEDGEVPATSQLTVTYLRPGEPGPLQVRGRVRTRGRHLTVCEADVEQDGRSVAHAVATFAILDRR